MFPPEHHGEGKPDRTGFIKVVQETQDEQKAGDISRKRKRLAVAQKRMGELEIFRKKEEWIWKD